MVVDHEKNEDKNKNFGHSSYVLEGVQVARINSLNFGYLVRELEDYQGVLKTRRILPLAVEKNLLLVEWVSFDRSKEGGPKLKPGYC